MWAGSPKTWLASARCASVYFVILVSSCVYGGLQMHRISSSSLPVFVTVCFVLAGM